MKFSLIFPCYNVANWIREQGGGQILYTTALPTTRWKTSRHSKNPE